MGDSRLLTRRSPASGPPSRRAQAMRWEDDRTRDGILRQRSRYGQDPHFGQQRPDHRGHGVDRRRALTTAGIPGHDRDDLAPDPSDPRAGPRGALAGPDGAERPRRPDRPE